MFCRFQQHQREAKVLLSCCKFCFAEKITAEQSRFAFANELSHNLLEKVEEEEAILTENRAVDES